MFDDARSAEELLEAWQDAARAAELADRLVHVAAETLATADQRQLDAESLADLAEQASEAANRAADRARALATIARSLAAESREADRLAARNLTAAEIDVGDKRGIEMVAHDRYTKRAQDEASRSGRVQDQDARSAPEPPEL